MIIDISDDLRIVHNDGLNYTIEHQRAIKESHLSKHAGEKKWKVVGYYGTLDQAVGAILTRHIGLLAGNRRLSLKLNHVKTFLEQAVDDVRRAVERGSDVRSD